jgi:hypothetical protein
MDRILNEEVVVVSGLPRSGTSLVMALLQQAGFPLLMDDHRLPDDDNRGGYFEYKPVKNLRVSSECIKLARGKGVKVVSPLLQHLPSREEYRIILMLRNCEEIYASQQVMLQNRGFTKRENREAVIGALSNQIREVKIWLKEQKNMLVHTINYSQLVFEPFAECSGLCRFLGLNENLVESMVGLVEPDHYRQRI